MMEEPELVDLRRQDLVVDGGDFVLTIGPGKIVVWLGRKTPDATIETILRAVARADPRTVVRDPLNLPVPAEEIPRLERAGLELMGYALPGGPALFRVPFAHPEAVAFYARHLAERRARGDTEETLLWRATPLRLRRLLQGLQPLGAEVAARPRTSD